MGIRAALNVRPVTALALLVRLERQEGESGVGRIASKAESGNSEGAEDIRNIPGYGRDLVADLTRVFQRSSGGSLYGDDEVALIFGGNKSLGHFPENESGLQLVAVYVAYCFQE